MVAIGVEDADLSSFRVCLSMQHGTMMKANEVRRNVMSTLIAKLHTEHVRLAGLVRLLNHQSCLRTDASAPNIALLVDALCYLTRFPDVSHHVIEDRMVDVLLAKKALSAEVGQEIESQHATLIRDGRDLLRDLESAVREENMSQELVDIRIRLYAERLRHNMVVEELTLFPAAEKSLSEADWRTVEGASSQARPDPLFDNEPDERFAELFRVITAEATTVSAEFPF
jgi:hemerythrin-like domain-containing protein